MTIKNCSDNLWVYHSNPGKLAAGIFSSEDHLKEWKFMHGIKFGFSIEIEFFGSISDLQRGAWVVHENDGAFSLCAFSCLEKGKAWIAEEKKSCVLSWYPIDEGAFDWATRNGYFKVKKPHQNEAKFIANFSSSGVLHFHFQQGEE